MMKADLITVRPYDPSGDEGFLYYTWLKGLRNRYGPEHPDAMISSHIFYPKYRAQIKEILNAKDTRIQVSCLKETPDLILGYAVLKGQDTLHWVFVRHDWRKIGIAKDLIPTTIDTVTFLTIKGARLMPKTWVYKPFTPQGDTDHDRRNA